MPFLRNSKSDIKYIVVFLPRLRMTMTWNGLNSLYITTSGVHNITNCGKYCITISIGSYKELHYKYVFTKLHCFDKINIYHTCNEILSLHYLIIWKTLIMKNVQIFRISPQTNLLWPFNCSISNFLICQSTNHVLL